MKTCKDCIYYESVKVDTPSDGIDRIEYGKCHCVPDGPIVANSYWCGQLKEKVHVEAAIGDMK